MLQTSIQLYRNAYSGVSKPMWWLALVLLVNRSGTMVIPFLTVYLTSRGYTLGQAGFIMGVFGLGGILGAYLGGRLTDKIGFFKVQLFSLLLNGCLFFVLGKMEGFWQLCSCIFILSVVGEAFRPANAAAIAAYSTESNRTRSYSLNRLAVNLGWAIGPALGGFLASISYSLLFVVDGMTCIIAAGLLYLFLSPPTHQPVTGKKAFVPQQTASAYRDKVFLLAMGFLFLVMICFFQLFNTVAAYYKQEVRLPEASIGWILAMNGLIIVLVEMVLVYKLEHRRGNMDYMATGAALIGVSYLVLSLHVSLAAVLIAMTIITFGEMFLFPFVNTFWVQRSNESNRGQYAALHTMTFAATMVVAPTMSSQIEARFGFNALWMINLCLCIAGAAGFLWLKKKYYE